MTGPEVAALLGLEPLPHEGGMWAQTWIDDLSTAIYFLMQPGDFSAMHRLDGPEIWHHYAGDPVRLVLLHDDGMVTRPTLGDDLDGRGAALCRGPDRGLDGRRDDGRVVVGRDDDGTRLHPGGLRVGRS